ncbi:DUF5301 domain-containing protein [Anaerofustis butyriciformans]|uniref:DUF5301 domain-containing protein n=1 Tax=Anaerofustis butyriciformans TaxID=3108533 RepID=UPI002E32D9D3|nr:DUF5301 domain-containing protein [Anaerofustis sp. HA2171]
MKKYLLICLICSLLFVGCSKTASPISLPKAGDIDNVNVSFEGKKIYHSDKSWINDVVSKMGDAKPTRKESVQDVPKVDNYIKVDFKVKKENFTVFAYEEKGKYYIERPYQGIYEIDDNLYQKLQQK